MEDTTILIKTVADRTDFFFSGDNYTAFIQESELGIVVHGYLNLPKRVMSSH